MNKAILVIDMPKNCQECVLNYQGDCYVSEYDGDDWVQFCPLKEAPTWLLSIKPEADEYVRGWNDCVNKIIGDEDETD